MLALARIALWLRTNPKLALAILLLTAALSFSFWQRHQGAESVRKEVARSNAKADAVIARQEAQAEQITAKVSTNLNRSRDQIHHSTQALLARVKTDVPPSDDARCRIGPLFVRDFNAAVSGLAVAPIGPESPGPAAPDAQPQP